ncbi:MAG: hypothetical protein OXE52_02900 [Chloroflexi bacterium]|nr:hypothetical protein [Chloroflexota bacterium]
MSEKPKDPHQDLKDNRHGIVTVAGIVVFIIIGLLTRGDLIFGLVMGAIYASSLNLGRHIAIQIAANAPAEHLMPAKLFGSAISAIIVAIITFVILSIIQGAIDVSPAEGDDIVATIVKSFFDRTASLAVGAGVLAGGLTGRPAAD